MPSIAMPGPLGPPPPTGTFNTPAEYKDILQSHAANNGYAIISNSYVPLKKAAWVCSKSGGYDSRGKDPDIHVSKKRRNTLTTKCWCPFRIRATYDVSTNWIIHHTNLEHNHKPVSANSALPHHRTAALSCWEHDKVIEMNTLGNTPIQILQALRIANPRSVLVVRDIYNLLYCLQVEELNGSTPVEWLLKVSKVEAVFLSLLTIYIDSSRYRLQAFNIYKFGDWMT